MTQQISPPVAAPAAPPSRGTQPARDDSTAPDSFSDALQAAHPGGAPPGEQTATDARTAQSGGGANGGDSSGATKKPKAAAPAPADAAGTPATDAQAAALAAATQALAQTQAAAPAPTPAPAGAGQQPAAPAPGQGAVPTALAAAAAQLAAAPAAPAAPGAAAPAPAAPTQAAEGAAPKQAAPQTGPVAQDASAAAQAATATVAATAASPVATAPAAAQAPVAPKARSAKQTAAVQAAPGQAKQTTAQNVAARFGSTAGDRQSSGNPAQPGTAPLSADGQTAVGGQQGQAGAPVVTAQAPASAAPSVRTAELAERMQTVIRVANRQGSAAARITMRPAELGGVAVQIRAHDGGITARLTADTAVGAEALAEAGHELRRSLESAGVTVHGLDVQLNGQGTDAREGQGSGSRALAETLGASDGGGDDAAAEETETTIEPTRLPLAGALVDVLV